MVRPIHAVDQQDVLPAIAVVIEKGATRAKRFRQQLSAVGAVVVLKLDACRGRHVNEPQSQRRV